ncbi:MAG TPA: DnaJ domain-containing protein [Pseudobacteroides sp.]|uniref:DnaJ domain-containing protein n=1 Tax=Pseudobacteroides sp. TaxID=1968840 RepID=UPI002F91D5E3
MAEQRDSYEVLGLKKEAGKDDIIKRYNLLMKKYKGDKNIKSDEDRKRSIEEIEAAYNLLMGYDFDSLAGGKLSEEAKKPPNPILKKINVDEKKLGNVIYYYKIPVIIGIIVLVSVFLLIKSIVTNVEPDLIIKLVGLYPSQGVETLEDKIEAGISGTKEVQIDPIVFWDKANPAVESSMEMKFVTMSGTGKVDAYFLDKERFDKLMAMTNRVQELDHIVKKYENKIDAKNIYKVKLKNKDTEHVYGIGVEKSSLFKGTGLENFKIILSVGVDGDNDENTMKLIDLLLK